MNSRPLALTDLQLELVQRAAARLSLDQRDTFLRGLAARLGEHPSTPAVEAVINLMMAPRLDGRR